MPDLNIKQVDSILDEFKKYYGKLSALVVTLVGATIGIITFIDTKPWHVIGIVFLSY